MRVNKTIFFFFLILFVVGFSFLFFSTTRRDKKSDSILVYKNQPKSTSLEVGSPAPDFELPDLTGRMIRLSDLRGKVVFLNIWATWCPPCVSEMPQIEKLHRSMLGRSFIILAAGQDSSDEDAVRKFCRKTELTFPVLLDSSQRLSRLYRVTGYPETFIIDKEGVIAAKILGARDWASAEWLKTFENLAEG